MLLGGLVMVPAWFAVFSLPCWAAFKTTCVKSGASGCRYGHWDRLVHCNAGPHIVTIPLSSAAASVVAGWAGFSGAGPSVSCGGPIASTQTENSCAKIWSLRRSARLGSILVDPSWVTKARQRLLLYMLPLWYCLIDSAYVARVRCDVQSAECPHGQDWQHKCAWAVVDVFVR